MSYTPLNNVTDELEGLNIKNLNQSEQFELIIELLQNQLIEQRITNEIMKEAFNIDATAVDINRDDF